MNKQQKSASKSPVKQKSEKTKKDAKPKDEKAKKQSTASARRETVESVIIAVILAFLFRAFVAEAFVIPTGSMAPTLQGKHKDINCPKCSHQYRTGASSEDGEHPREVVGTRCPICGYALELDKSKPNERSFTGDRILVNKFCFWFGEPRRWDVIVFKFPGNAVQNYIKRLVGLPNEEIRIYRGDIYVKKEGEADFNIARKPIHKLLSMMQLVDDTDHIPQQLRKVGWPNRWQFWSETGGGDDTWSHSSKDEAWSVTCDGSGPESFVRYRHLVPSYYYRMSRTPAGTPISEHHADWDRIEAKKELPPDMETRFGMLITDYYTYNDQRDHHGMGSPHPPCMGFNWVGDLALEADVNVINSKGILILDLIEGGVHYQARIDVASGEATLQSVDGPKFVVDDESVAALKAQTVVKGPGKYTFRFSNIDDQLNLWVNNKLIKFDGDGVYSPPEKVMPAWSEQDPGDMSPAGIGSNGAAFKVTRMKILRDIYYLAHDTNNRHDNSDYHVNNRGHLVTAFSDPTSWEELKIFDRMTSVEFKMGDDQFFPLGDNSPASRDARIWNARYENHSANGNYVDRQLLIGKAIMIYWPHAWRRPIPFLPNVQRMGLIR